MSEPYFVEVARADRRIGWEKVAAVALAVGLIGQAFVLVERVGREVPHIDVAEVAELPVERLKNVTPDIMNALGLSREVAERMLRLNAATIADDQAWTLNLMVPELAEAYAKEVPRIIGMTREVKGEVRVHVKSVTPVQAHLPFKVEVVVVEEFLGDYKPPGRGRADPDNPRREEYRLALTFVRTAKSHINRDALLIRELSMATTK
ncbi:MAG: hypothetical protein U0166_00710 [Acidobacteriota bacterium]